MGTRETEQPPLWVAASDLPKSPGHPFYTRLNAMLDAARLRSVRGGPVSRVLRAGHGTTEPGAGSVLPVAAGRLLRRDRLGTRDRVARDRLVGGPQFCAAGGGRGGARSFDDFADAAPDRPRDAPRGLHLGAATAGGGGLLKGKTVAIDATTLEANAAMRSIVRRDTGESYQEFLTRLAQASGIETPTREDLARLDRKRKKKTSNKDWTNPGDPDAKVAKMKDGRTHLAHKAEHAVDLETGAMVAVTLQGADQGDTTTIVETVIAAAEQIEDAQADVDGAAAAGRDHRRQGLSQQSDDGRPGRRWRPLLRRGAGPWSPRLVEGAGGPGAGVWQSAADSWRAGTAPDASTRREDRTLVRASLRHGWDAPHASARPHEYPEAPADSCGRLQSRARHAPPDRRRHAARAAGPPGGRPSLGRRAVDAYRSNSGTAARRPPSITRLRSRRIIVSSCHRSRASNGAL